MSDDWDGYAPGFGEDALAMLRRRDTADRAAFVLPYLADGARVLDIGCGPGTITVGLADAVAPHGIAVGVDRVAAKQWRATQGPCFLLGTGYRLPLATGSVDVVFGHALFEHLARPADALAELRRVLVPRGVLALCSSDWSGALLRPWNSDVRTALHGHYRLRRAAGGDPFAGGVLAGWVRAAGFGEVRQAAHNRVDMGYEELARYVGARLRVAGDDEELRRAADSAERWAGRDGEFVQRWVEVLASA